MLSNIIDVIVILILIYGVFIVICSFKDHQSLIEEQEDRRIRQNLEWREQFNQLPMTVRASIRLMREDQRDRAYVIALMLYNNRINQNKISEEKVDWKKEGF